MPRLFLLCEATIDCFVKLRPFETLATTLLLLFFGSYKTTSCMKEKDGHRQV